MVTENDNNLLLTLDDFKKVELRTAKVIDVADHPQADRLLVLTVEVGNEQKQIVAGIKENYSKEKLKGKTVILVNNIKPVSLRGVVSNGMLLAAKNGNKLVVITTDGDIPSGSTVS